MTTAGGILRDSRRSECYSLFSACFYPPERGPLLQDGTCLRLAAALDELRPDAGAASCARVLHRQLLDLSETQLRVDHAALFVGPFTLKAPPYGSIYLERNNTLMGETTLAAAACYREAGLEVTLHEPPDHIAVELEFMHYLACLATRATHDGDRDEAARLAERQRQFLDEHLGAWAPAFCAAVRRGATTLFYQALADCLQAFLDMEVRRSRTVLPAAARPPGGVE
jgi:putative dimethyl sulfoxide reductase chaperone